MDIVLEGKKIVGAKQTLKAIKNGSVKTVYVAMDAEVRVTKTVIDACVQNSVELVYVETMHRLGSMCAIDVGAAIACVLNTGN